MIYRCIVAVEELSRVGACRRYLHMSLGSQMRRSRMSNVAPAEASVIPT